MPHPSGSGWYSETYRSAGRVTRHEGQGDYNKEPNKENERSAMSIIYALLKQGQQFWWHRLKSDEAFYFHKGCALEIHQLKPTDDGGEYQCTVVGDGDDAVLHHVVPAGTWFSQNPVHTSQENDFNLCSVAVSPGFDLKDYESVTDIKTLCQTFPKHADKIRELSTGR